MIKQGIPIRNRQRIVWQWIAAVLSVTSLLTAVIAIVQDKGFLGFAASLGATGWGLACLLMDPQVRRDLFGSRFDEK